MEISRDDARSLRINNQRIDIDLGDLRMRRQQSAEARCDLGHRAGVARRSLARAVEQRGGKPRLFKF